jgi:hypothetical protein
MPFIVATYVYASSQGQRTYSARTNYVYASSQGQRTHSARTNILKPHSLFHAKFGKMQSLVCVTTMMMNVIRSLSQFDVICLECLAWSTWGCFLGCLPQR